MTTGPRPMARIERAQRDNGAHCITCGWLLDGCNRQRALKHARDLGHKVRFHVETITTYHGRVPR